MSRAAVLTNAGSMKLEVHTSSSWMCSSASLSFKHVCLNWSCSKGFLRQTNFWSGSYGSRNRCCSTESSNRCQFSTKC
ncbi:hypothetical protein BpHYR1_054558 [Brachionus plicatilis]|uniref:Uncharacterized protein n=1 Tax=Brachionus plicatilis TaxID=10195 RepID=A0A3M7SER6_BRAPC|nr:hypothetical protein BpHYR1_054558 [Brachionus plicatilis]